MIMHVMAICTIWCGLVVGCHARPRLLSTSSIDPWPRSRQNPYSIEANSRGSPDVLIIPRANGNNRSSSASHWSSANAGPVSYPLSFNPSPSNQLQDPSSSGPFTPITFPPGWEIYPTAYTSTSAIISRPIQLTASVLEIFYTKVLAACARFFWDSAPLTTGLVCNLGELSLTLVGDPKREGLPWGILALLLHGMLERARR